MMIDKIKDFVTSQDPDKLFLAINDIEKKCQEWQNELESWQESANQEYYSIIENYNLNNIKERGNPIFKLVNLDLNSLDGNKIKEIYDEIGGEELFDKVFKKQTQNKANDAFNELQNFYYQNLKRFKDLLPKYLFAKEVRPKLWHLQFFIYIWNEIRDIAYRENIFLLSNTPLLLKQVTEQTDSPFIYERIGQWYQHFMIDEFQDTSRYQWMNLLPFIENNIAEYDSNQNPCSVNNLIIGDVKQAIYRFRGGDWKLLHEEVKQKFKNCTQEISLKKNYRSSSTIVQFNNIFFQFLSEKFQKLDFSENNSSEKNGKAEKIKNPLESIYSDCKQEVNNENQGYVSIELIPTEKDDSDFYINQTLEKVKATIQKLLDAGASYGDIVILTRKNENGKKVIEYLLNSQGFEQLPIATDDVLTIGESCSVLAIINVLNYLIQPCDYFKAKAVWHIASALGNNDNFSFSELENNPFANKIVEKTSQWTRMPLIDVVIDIINEFKLNTVANENIYLQQFIWLVVEFTSQQPSHIQSFLNFWNDRGRGVKVPPPASSDALRVMTIHKSKGLEFKHVIIPFLDGEIKKNNEQAWIWGLEPYPEMPFLVSLSSKASFSSYAKSYYQEMYNYLIDSVNLVYVAFTRAKTTLHVFTKETEKSEKTEKIQIERWINDFIEDVHSNPNFFFNNEDNQCILEYGNFAAIESNASKIALSKHELEQIHIQISLNNHQQIKIQHQQFSTTKDDSLELPARQFGTVLHKVLEQIDTVSDLPNATRKMVLSGFIPATLENEIIERLKSAFDDPQVQPWFDKNNRIIRERAIIGKNISLSRPDRIIITPDQSIVVIDYKFTHEELDEHNHQVKNYIGLLKKAGYNNIQGFVWYLLKKKIVEVK